MSGGFEWPVRRVQDWRQLRTSTAVKICLVDWTLHKVHRMPACSRRRYKEVTAVRPRRWLRVPGRNGEHSRKDERWKALRPDGPTVQPSNQGHFAAGSSSPAHQDPAPLKFLNDSFPYELWVIGDLRGANWTTQRAIATFRAWPVKVLPERANRRGLCRRSVFSGSNLVTWATVTLGACVERECESGAKRQQQRQGRKLATFG